MTRRFNRTLAGAMKAATSAAQLPSSTKRTAQISQTLLYRRPAGPDHGREQLQFYARFTRNVLLPTKAI